MNELPITPVTEDELVALAKLRKMLTAQRRPPSEWAAWLDGYEFARTGGRLP